ncbi:MAG: 50S ribosomal protein L13 [Dehalococcoidia bacterium]|nr:50S ribosomal protein L13 [Dehalococcoidia bacterium]
MKRNKSYMAKPSDIAPQWHLVDATGQTLGRLATRISRALQGKDKPTYTPHMLTGDYVIVVNAGKVRVTGRKPTQKVYYKHSGYVGNLKTYLMKDMLETNPERVIQLAVKGMLPKTSRGREMLGRLRVYKGESHPHEAQQPVEGKLVVT